MIRSVEWEVEMEERRIGVCTCIVFVRLCVNISNLTVL